MCLCGHFECLRDHTVDNCDHFVCFSCVFMVILCLFVVIFGVFFHDFVSLSLSSVSLWSFWDSVVLMCLFVIIWHSSNTLKVHWHLVPVSIHPINWGPHWVRDKASSVRASSVLQQHPAACHRLWRRYNCSPLFPPTNITWKDLMKCLLR